MTTEIEFVSCLTRDLHAFLALKRATGRSYKRTEFRLRSFDRFTAKHANKAGEVQLGHIIPLWLARHGGSCKSTTIHAEFSVVRQFCLFLRRRAPDCYIPGLDLVPSRRGSRFLPYIFTVADIRRLLRGTETLNSSAVRGHPVHLFAD